jgi:DNA-binding transcriptional regulator YiaG
MPFFIGGIVRILKRLVLPFSTSTRPIFLSQADMTPRQLRAARGFLNWSRTDLAHLTAISVETIRNVECSRYNPAPATLEKLKRCFADHGIEFMGDQHMQGVMLVSKARRKGQPKTR